MGCAQANGGDSIGSELCLSRLDRGNRTSEDIQARRIHGCDCQLSVDVRSQLHVRQRHSDHCTTRGRLHEAAARGHQSEAIFQRKDACKRRGDILAETMSDHRMRLDTPRAQERGNRILDGKQAWLREFCLIEAVRVRAPSRKQRGRKIKARALFQKECAFIQCLDEILVRSDRALRSCRGIAIPVRERGRALEESGSSAGTTWTSANWSEAVRWRRRDCGRRVSGAARSRAGPSPA